MPTSPAGSTWAIQQLNRAAGVWWEDLRGRVCVATNSEQWWRLWWLHRRKQWTKSHGSIFFNLYMHNLWLLARHSSSSTLNKRDSFWFEITYSLLPAVFFESTVISYLVNFFCYFSFNNLRYFIFHEATVQCNWSCLAGWPKMSRLHQPYLNNVVSSVLLCQCFHFISDILTCWGPVLLSDFFGDIK